MFVDDAAHKIKVFTVLDGEQGSAGKLLLSKRPLEVIATWLPEDYFPYRAAESAVAHNDDDVLLLPAILFGWTRYLTRVLRRCRYRSPLGFGGLNYGVQAAGI